MEEFGITDEPNNIAFSFFIRMNCNIKNQKEYCRNCKILVDILKRTIWN